MPPPEDVDGIETYLRGKARDPELLERGLPRLAAYRERARRERFPLDAEAKADKDEIRAAINDVVPAPWAAASIELVSGRNPFPRPAWQVKHHYRESLRHILRDGLDGRLRADPRNRPAHAAAPELEQAIGKAFGERLGTAVCQSYPMLGRLDGDERLKHCLRHNARAALVRYLDLVLSGEVEASERLGRVVDLMLRWYPLGPLRSEPNAWLVLVD